MGTAVQVGVESVAHGTVAGSFISVPCDFAAVLNQQNKVLDEDRQGQDRHYAMQKGASVQEFEVGESGIYHDTIGYWLRAAMGTPVSTAAEVTAFDNVFKFADDPNSLSLKWQQPRRYTQAYQSLYAVVDEMEFSFEAEGDLAYTLKGLAQAETEVAQITHSFTDTVPMPAWAGTVTLGGGANTRLVRGKVGFKRNRKPFYTIRNEQSPKSMSAGARTVEFELTLDFDSKAEYDDFKAATNDSLLITWVDATTTIGSTLNPEFEITLGTIAYESGEIDTGEDYPLVTLSGKALYDSSDASLAVIRVQSDVDYEA